MRVPGNVSLIKVAFGLPILKWTPTLFFFNDPGTRNSSTKVAVSLDTSCDGAYGTPYCFASNQSVAE